MRLRTKAREATLNILYQIDISKLEPCHLFTNYIEYNPQQEEIVNFAKILVDGVVENKEHIDLLIKKYAKNWGINRMAVIDRSILRMASYELLYLQDVPPKVSINEAIELAKRFGDVDSPRFVNGILDKIYKMECRDKNDQQSV